ncbi:hypothetical protein [Natrinema soli]|uniref:Uncharacterized protein n=1 Tax=Natrinema soli TaxID=1930624 RepID=A0ABD5T0T1_9EURY|nr:hypothetical protein [Natrinema soli]
MTRNTVMAAIAILCLVALISGALDLYRAFSFVGAAIILAVVASAAIEQNDRELSIAPYTGIVAIFAASFLAGFVGIWLTWEPGQTEYSYAMGVPVPTLAYFAFIWLLPLTASIYYALIFDRIASEEIVDEILDEARSRQRGRSFPLAPEWEDRPPAESERTEVADE